VKTFEFAARPASTNVAWTNVCVIVAEMWAFEPRTRERERERKPIPISHKRTVNLFHSEYQTQMSWSSEDARNFQQRSSMWCIWTCIIEDVT
jgi:hypothetical protein